MRIWPALLLLSCSRPNPLFFVDSASGDMSSGTDATSAAATTAIETTTATSAPLTTTTTDAATTLVPTTDALSTTGEPDTTGGGPPGCGLFSEQRLILDPPLPQAQCVAVTQYFGKVTKPNEDEGTIALCADASCGVCAFTVPLDPDLALYLTDGACVRVVHEGLWAPGDPEAPSSCKTTGLAIYDDASVYPLYAASSRVVQAPSFLDPQVRLEVERDAGVECTCAADDCCDEGRARDLRLKFSDQGQPVATLGAEEFAPVELAGVGYALAVIRAHAKGYFTAPSQQCVAEPETNFVDWHMLRLQGP